MQRMNSKQGMARMARDGLQQNRTNLWNHGVSKCSIGVSWKLDDFVCGKFSFRMPWTTNWSKSTKFGSWSLRPNPPKDHFEWIHILAVLPTLVQFGSKLHVGGGSRCCPWYLSSAGWGFNLMKTMSFEGGELFSWIFSGWLRLVVYPIIYKILHRWLV